MKLLQQKSKILTLLLLAVLPLFLVGCTLQDLPLIGDYFGESTKKQGTINIWGMWESPEVMKTLSDNYIAQNPDVVINYDDRTVLSPLDLKERVFSRADQTGAGVDIMLVHNSWIERLRDRLVPMPSSLLSASDYDQKFYPVATQSAVFDGQIYGVPLYHDGLVLVYNKDHFDEVGQVEAPTAWEEFRRLALELTIRGQDDEILRAGAAMGTADNIDFFSDILGLMFSQAGSAIPEDLDKKPAQDVLAYYVTFSLEDEVWSNALPEATSAFVQEKVSMIFVPTWVVLDILRARPDLDVGVAPVPQALPDQQVTWGSFWMGVVPQSSENQELAWDYLNYLTQEEQQRTWFTEASKIRAFGPPYSLKSLAPEVAENAYISPVLEGAPFASSAEISGRSGNRRQFDALKDAVNAVLSGDATPAEAMEVVKVELSR